MSDIKKDIKRCEQLIKPEHANWIGISNQLAIAHVVDRVKELEAKQEIKQIVDKIPVNEIEKRIKIDEQEQAIQELERFNREGRIFATSVHEAIDIAIKTTKENSAEILQKNTELAEKNAEIEQKDRQIDLMAEYIDSNNYVDNEECQFQWDFNIKKCIENGDCKDCIKQYFERKSKE